MLVTNPTVLSDFALIPRKKSLRNFKKNEVGQWESIMYNKIEQQNQDMTQEETMWNLAMKNL